MRSKTGHFDADQWIKLMRRRFRSFFWRALDWIMPDGPPVFLMLTILMLLIVNGLVLMMR
jgi:hypothetical protein